jgi:hypothetical protein
VVAADYETWKVQMESKLNKGLSSEIKILNVLMKHQTVTHNQLLKFKNILAVLGGKYKSAEQLAGLQQAKITQLEQQLSALSQQVATQSAKFEAYKKHYDVKWAGSQTAIEDLYKKTANALGAMSTVHDDVQQQLSAMTTATPSAATVSTAAPSLPPSSTAGAAGATTVAPPPSGPALAPTTAPPL